MKKLLIQNMWQSKLLKFVILSVLCINFILSPLNDDKPTEDENEHSQGHLDHEPGVQDEERDNAGEIVLPDTVHLNQKYRYKGTDRQNYIFKGTYC